MEVDNEVGSKNEKLEISSHSICSVGICNNFFYRITFYIYVCSAIDRILGLCK